MSLSSPAHPRLEPGFSVQRLDGRPLTLTAWRVDPQPIIPGLERLTGAFQCPEATGALVQQVLSVRMRAPHAGEAGLWSFRALVLSQEKGGWFVWTTVGPVSRIYPDTPALVG
jgi:hypothetical protein